MSEQVDTEGHEEVLMVWLMRALEGLGVVNLGTPDDVGLGRPDKVWAQWANGDEVQQAEFGSPDEIAALIGEFAREAAEVLWIRLPEMQNELRFREIIGAQS